jgi:hypothetical protein
MLSIESLVEGLERVEQSTWQNLAVAGGCSLIGYVALGRLVTYSYPGASERKVVPNEILAPIQVARIENATEADIRFYFEESIPVLLDGMCSKEWKGVPEHDANANFGMICPINKLGAGDCSFNETTYQEVVANQAKEKARGLKGQELDDIHFFDKSDTVIQARKVRYRESAFYAISNLGFLPEDTRMSLDRALAPCLKMLKPWKRISTFWVGPSPGSLHYDDFDNILCQLHGKKKVVMYAVEETMKFNMTHWLSRFANHSTFDSSFLCKENMQKYPELRAIKRWEVELGPGDSLLIPAGVLHAPAGDIDSVAVNLLLTDGPQISTKGKKVCERIQWSTFFRTTLFGARMTHYNFKTLTI